jgi:hypothetical protein
LEFFLDCGACCGNLATLLLCRLLVTWTRQLAVHIAVDVK